VDAIQAGDADGHLSEVRDAEVDFRDRTSVKNALDERGVNAE
jgi:hypothetical protein